MKRLIVFCLLLFAVIDLSADERVLLISATSEAEKAPQLSALIRRAYTKIGRDIQFEYLPGNRAIRKVREGESIDGELLRSEQVEPLALNLLKVPVVIWRSKVIAYTVNVDMQVNGWGSLKPYQLGVISGYQNTFEKTHDFPSVHFGKSSEELFRMLERGRIQIAVVHELAAKRAMKNVLSSDIRALSPPVQEVPLYHYIHKKHASLLPALTKALQEEVDNLPRP